MRVFRNRKISLRDVDTGRAFTAEAVEAVADAVTGLYAAEVTAEWGERCPDFEPECGTCRAWKEFDDWRAS